MRSTSQRKFLWANHPDVAREFENHTPKGTKLPDHVKRGMFDALVRYGLKSAAEELRLKIPSRTFHGFDAAHKSEAVRNTKRADATNATSETLEKMLEQIDAPASPADMLTSRDPLDRSTAWGAPSSLNAGDTANRLSDMGQNTTFGGV